MSASSEAGELLYQSVEDRLIVSPFVGKRVDDASAFETSSWDLS